MEGPVQLKPERNLASEGAHLIAEALFFLHQLSFQLLDQAADQGLEFRLAAAESRLMANGLVAHAQVGQHQLQESILALVFKLLTRSAEGYDGRVQQPLQLQIFQQRPRLPADDAMGC